jgi:hypothetical protein
MKYQHKDERRMTSSAQLIVFHPSPFMVEALDKLISEVAPELSYENLVLPNLLDEAMRDGIGAKIKEKIRTAIESIPTKPSRVILCSCSTLGGCAEEMQPFTSNRVLRIDRPMAEAAVQTGTRIGVAAALQSTIEPTKALLEDVAQKAGREIEFVELFCDSAWKIKQAGDDKGYINAIVEYLRNEKPPVDVIVLAQGSMAAAVPLLADLGISVLSSPRLAIEAVAKLCRTAN